jgi:nitrate reductase gamma subunit
MKSGTMILAILLCLSYPAHRVESSWLIDPERFHVSVHGQFSCLEYHSDINEKIKHPDVLDVDKPLNDFFRLEQCAACHEYVLNEINQKRIHHSGAIDEKGRYDLCIECHDAHYQKAYSGSAEKSGNDQLLDTTLNAHSDVTCGACRLNDVILVNDLKDNKVLWQNYPGPRGASKIHEMSLTDDDASCGRCHFKGNDLGAPANILPAKGIICMPCHAATFSIGDAPTAISLLVFLIGIINILFIWFSGDRPERRDAVRSRKIIEALLLDVLLQRRLFTVSRIRWFFHAVIFYSVILRFGWGLVALLSSPWFNQWSWVRAMLDKNHPLTAFLFDVTGVMMIIGLSCIILRTKVIRSTNRIEGMPKRDWPAYGLLGAIIVAGFILEAMRISMTGGPKGSKYAFMGYGISRIINGAHLTDLYGTVWYIHAIFTAAFVSYLPFSRMLHVIIAPISLAISACSRK